MADKIKKAYLIADVPEDLVKWLDSMKDDVFIRSRTQALILVLTKARDINMKLGIKDVEAYAYKDDEDIQML